VHKRESRPSRSEWRIGRTSELAAALASA